MRDYCDDIKDIPSHLCGECFRDNSLCLYCAGRVEEYKQKPFFIWDNLPEGCRFSGWIFLKREDVKQKIRKKKEKILSLRVKLKDSEGMKAKRILREIEKYEKEVKAYKEYGSDCW